MRVQVLRSVCVKVEEVQAAMLAAQQASMSCKCPNNIYLITQSHVDTYMPSDVPGMQTQVVEPGASWQVSNMLKAVCSVWMDLQFGTLQHCISSA